MGRDVFWRRLNCHFIRKGKQYLLNRISAYNAAASHKPWIVLVDLDQDAQCAPPRAAERLPSPAAFMCLRIAVRETEFWLLADRERFSGFMSVSKSRVPEYPDLITDPKQFVVNLARHSRKRDVREDGCLDSRAAAWSDRHIPPARRKYRYYR